MILRFGNKWLAWGSNLIAMPTTLFTYIMSAFSNGFTRNMALSSIGNHDNALMGSYLLAVTNISISIAGFMATDTVWDIGTGLEVTNITKTSGLITLQNTAKYGAFEIRRAGAVIGRYCLTERLGARLINQYRGSGYLPNGLLNGTLTNIWQRSNAYYAETNKTGYSIAGAGWYADATGTQALTQYSFIPADLDNPTKCLAWVGGVQQDLQFVGKASNNVSLIPIAFFFNNDRYCNFGTYSGTLTSHRILVRMSVISTASSSYVYFERNGNKSIYFEGGQTCVKYKDCPACGIPYMSWMVNTPLEFESNYSGSLGTVTFTVKNLLTGQIAQNSVSGCPASITLPISYISIGLSLVCYYSQCEEWRNGVKAINLVPSYHTTDMYELVSKSVIPINGVVTNLVQNVNICNLSINSVGYELWVSGTDYRIYHLANNGTRMITPAGYTLVETVAPNTMPSVADSRLSTVKYSLANSNDLYESVPEAFNIDATPKALSYAELSALTNNIKVTKTEVNGKITNLTIRQ